MSITTNIFLDNRRYRKKTAKLPLKLRVISGRNSKEYQTVFELTVADYNKLKAPNISTSLQVIRDGIKAIQADIDSFVQRVAEFNFSEFKRDFIDNHHLFRRRNKALVTSEPEAPSEFDYSDYYRKFPIIQELHTRGTISYNYCLYIKKLISEKRLGSAFVYRGSYNSLRKFGGNINFQKITPSFLRQYEIWMTEKQGRSKTYVGILLRTLRTIFNEAIDQKIINRELCYPFGRKKYQIPTARKVKKALTKQELKLLYDYVATQPNEAYAKDLWFMLYFGNGMNPTDLAHLVYGDIDGKFIIFERQKTELSRRSDPPPPIKVFMNDDIRRIIDRWGNADNSNNNYIFPILKRGLTPLDEYKATINISRLINAWVKKIGNLLGFHIPVTNIIARRTFSNQLKRSQVSTEIIKEMMGHNSLSTTEIYLDSFEDEVVEETAVKLSEFKKENVMIEDLKSA